MNATFLLLLALGANPAEATGTRVDDWRSPVRVVRQMPRELPARGPEENWQSPVRAHPTRQPAVEQVAEGADNWRSPIRAYAPSKEAGPAKVKLVSDWRSPVRAHPTRQPEVMHFTDELVENWQSPVREYRRPGPQPALVIAGSARQRPRLTQVAKLFEQPERRPVLPRYPANQQYPRTHRYDPRLSLDYPWHAPRVAEPVYPVYPVALEE